MDRPFDETYQIFSPSGASGSCSTIVAAAGGWENITAEQASSLAQFGCFPSFIPETQDLYTGFTSLETLQTGDVSASPQPSTAPISQPDAEKPEEPIVNFSTDPSELDNPISWLAPIVSGFAPLGQGGGTDMTQLPSAPEVIDAIGRLFSSTSQVPQVTVNAGWAKCLRQKKRQRVKIAVMQDGSRQVVPYCAPRHMNPLNPRALRRAASRLGSFHRIASHIEKLVQKACKVKARSRAPRMGCAPKRCR